MDRDSFSDDSHFSTISSDASSASEDPIYGPELLYDARRGWEIDRSFKYDVDMFSMSIPISFLGKMYGTSFRLADRISNAREVPRGHIQISSDPFYASIEGTDD